MFNWLGKKQELHQCNSVVAPDYALEREFELKIESDNLKRQKEKEDHLRESAEYNLMEASYAMYVHFVDNSGGLRILRKFNGHSEIFRYGWGYDNGYNYIKPSVTAAEDMQLTKDTVHKRGIIDGDTVYLAHTISKVEFSEITTKGED
tara:strand:- start:204 stop:647 length:444 start_codon:yes stop_codon:yes gene_type:complete